MADMGLGTKRPNQTKGESVERKAAMKNKKKVLFKRLSAGTLAAVLATGMALPASAVHITDFDDVDGHWAYNALEWAVDNDVMVGVDGDSMNPDGLLTRAQMAAMMDRLYGTYKNADISKYTDVVVNSWYYNFIAQAVNMGTLVGYDHNTMGPNDFITREQAIVVIARTICLMTAASEDLSRFPDVNEVGAWSYDHICSMVEKEFVSGYGNGYLGPKDNITRAQMAQILSRIFSRIYESGTLTGTYDGVILVRGDVDIHDAKFTGDLIIANGLREDELDLDDVTIEGRLIVWGGSEIHVNGKSKVSGVVTPRNDDTVKVIFDRQSTRLSKKTCDVVYPDFMDRHNEVIWTEESHSSSGGGGGGGSVVVKRPEIAFTLPAHLYEGDKATVTTTLTNTDSVEWTLKKDGTVITMPAFTKDGGTLTFEDEGVYTLTGVAKRGSYTDTCEQTVTVHPVATLGFSLPEYSHTDKTTNVVLKFENGKDNDGTIVWDLKKDGAAYPIPESWNFNNAGGTLPLTEPGVYELTATYTDSLGKVYKETQKITILPVIELVIRANPNETHVDVAATVTANDAHLPVDWTLSQNGNELVWDSVTNSVLGATGGELLLPVAGAYQLQASVTDVSGRKFISNIETITVEGLVDLTMTAPEYSWTDRAGLVELSGFGEYPVSWEATKDGEPAAYTGTLNNNGGNIQFAEPGTYIVKATVKDRLGRYFSVEKSIEVLPVVALTAAVDKPGVHLDETVALSLTQENTVADQEIKWTVLKDRVPYDGLNLTDLTSVVFSEAGDYTFVASTEDIGGREYESNEVVVHVIENLSVSVSSDVEKTHEDKTADITLTVENGMAKQVDWTLTVDGVAVPDFTMPEQGGPLDLSAYGSGLYELTATVTDELGKTFSDTVAIQVYPVIDLTIDCPANVHIDRTAEVTLTGNDLEGKTVVWNVISETGTTVEHTLTNVGGTLSFTEPGAHIIGAYVTDELGRRFEAQSKTILVWNTIQLSFRLPEFAHTDETAIVKMTSENLRDNQIEWSLTVDGTPVALSHGTDGALNNEGGSVKFLQTGTNVLTATVTDEIGREFTYSQTIEVYPVLNLDLTATPATHTDETFDVSLQSDTGLPVTWTVAPSNDPSAEAIYSGTLNDGGGTIQIQEPGVYAIQASVQDVTGRVFTSNSAAVKVYPVAGISFTLPATTWTDSSVPVDLLTSDLTGQNVTWTLTKDGAPASMQDFVFGSLGDKGGSIRFTDVGDYTLTASATDEIGREYSWTQSIEVYPVIGLMVDTDPTAHTDTAIDVTLDKDNWAGENIYWTVLRNGVEVAPKFELTEDGGHGFLTEPGLYTFTARTTDELGRETVASDTIQVYPVAFAGFYIPEAFHTDEEVELKTDFRELGDNALYWTMTRNGEVVTPAEWMSGDLSAQGGTLQFREAGEYTLKAFFTDGGGRVYAYEQAFKVYPIPEMSWTLPSYAHTDTQIKVPVVSTNVAGVEGTTVKWYLDDTYGVRQNWDTYVAGTLTAEPGTIRIKHAGIFTLGCEVTDATGRVFNFDGPSIEVLAEQELNVEITEQEVYVGHDAEVLTLGNNNTLPIEWSLKKDGRDVDISDYVTGDLNNYGGFIQFTAAGSYELIGTMTDGLGRTFFDSDVIEVLPVGGLSFSISGMEYVGNDVPVIMDSIDNPLNADVQWSVEKDGSAFAMDVSSLGNNGGLIRFPEVGNYTLIATLDDGSGEPSVCRRDIKVIYKADLMVNAPATVHVGTPFDVSLNGSGTLNVVWGVKLGNKPVELDANTGLLTGTAGRLTLFETGTYTITATTMDDAGNPHTAFATVGVTNTAPAIDSFEATATRETQDGRYRAYLNATCSDPDGDEVHLEWDSEYQPDGWYDIGTHTIRVRAVDEWGATSAWESRTIEFQNDAPSIKSFVVSPTQNSNGDLFFCRIEADAEDPDGDQWRLEWDGDYHADGYYAVGSYTVRVRAVDEWGAASPWQTKSFEIEEQLSIRVTATSQVKPGETVRVTANQGNTSYPVHWTITKSGGGQESTAGLSDDGGSIRLTTPGTYTIRGEITGVSGATAHDEAIVVVVNNTIFSGKFSMNLYWANNGSDMDSHMYFYDSSGSEVGHVYFSKKQDCGCSLDIDDTKGGTGEWLTVDFDAIPSNVHKIDVSIYGFSGDAEATMILRQENTITDGMGNTTTEVKEPVRLSTHVGNHETVSFGYFIRSGDSWDFHGYDGSIVHGSGVVS